MMNSELEILYSGKLERLFREELGFQIVKQMKQVHLAVNYIADCLFVLKMGSFEIPIAVEIKGEINHKNQIKKFTDFASKFGGLTFCVANLIDDEIKKTLKMLGIGFYEIDKEIFFPIDFKINRNLNFHQINQNSLIKESGFRAESNIKLMLYFMCRPESLEWTQRELAKKLDLSLGSINKAINNLEMAKMIIVRDEKKYLGRFEDIVDRWRISFLDVEMKNQFMGAYEPFDNDFLYNWRQIEISKNDSYWGGEVAAGIRTGFLNPEIFSLYTYNESVSSLLQSFRLKKNPSGRVKIFRCFWPKDLNNQDGTIPDFITYCELLNTGNDRNLEVAGYVRNKIKKIVSRYEY